MAKSFDLSVIFKVTDKFTRPVQKIGRSIGGLTKPVNKFALASRVAFSKVDVGLRKLERRFEKTARKIERSGFTKIGTRMKDVGVKMATRITLPLAIFGGLAIRSAIDFQKSMNMVGAVTKTTGTPAFEKLIKLAKELGSTTQFSASEAAEGMKFLGMAGLNTNQILGALPRTLELAASAQIDLGTAADIVTNIMSGYRFETKELAEVNDVLVNAFTSSNTDLQQLGEAMKVVGPVAKAMEFRFKETAAALGILAKNAFQGTLGGTGLRRIMTNLVSLTPKAGKAIAGLGVKIFNTDGSLRDLTQVLESFEDAQARGVSQMKIAQAVMEAFGQRGGPQFLALLGAGSKELKKFEKNLGEVGTAAKVSEAQMEGLPGAFKLLASAFEAVQLAIVDSGIGKIIEELIRKFAKFLQKISEAHPNFLAFISIIGVLVAIIGPLIIIFGFFLSAIGTIATIFGTTAAVVGIAIAGITAAIVGLGFLAGTLIKYWEPVKTFFADLWGFIGEGLDFLPDFLKFKIGFTSDRQKGATSKGLKDLAVSQTNKSETDINIRVAADPGSTINTERVKSKKGNARVNLTTVGYVGAGGA